MTVSSGIAKTDHVASSSGTMQIDNGISSSIPSDDEDLVTITFVEDTLVEFGQDLREQRNTTVTEDVQNPAKECKKQLSAGLALGNTTQSSGRYLNCLIEKGTANMATILDEENEPQSSLAASTINTVNAFMVVV